MVYRSDAVDALIGASKSRRERSKRTRELDDHTIRLILENQAATRAARAVSDMFGPHPPADVTEVGA